MVKLTQLWYGEPQKVAVHGADIEKITANDSCSCWLLMKSGRKMLVQGTVGQLANKVEKAHAKQTA